MPRAGDTHSEGWRGMWGNVIPVLRRREVVVCWSDPAREAARDVWALCCGPSAGQDSCVFW